MRFIDDHRSEYGVEPICSLLPIAPSTYYAHKVREADPTQGSARAQRDEVLCVVIRRVYDEIYHVYGVRKVWRQLYREGIFVARRTVARLMKEISLSGVVRGHRMKTTIPADSADHLHDLVERNFKSDRTNQLRVADLT